MKAFRLIWVMIFAVTFLFVGVEFSLNPTDACADIKELKIGIGVDADSLNPQEQTTTLILSLIHI